MGASNREERSGQRAECEQQGADPHREWINTKPASDAVSEEEPEPTRSE